jgi:hypothetical protein
MEPELAWAFRKDPASEARRRASSPAEPREKAPQNA